MGKRETLRHRPQRLNNKEVGIDVAVNNGIECSNTSKCSNIGSSGTL